MLSPDEKHWRGTIASQPESLVRSARYADAMKERECRFPCRALSFPATAAAEQVVLTLSAGHWGLWGPRRCFASTEVCS